MVFRLVEDASAAPDVVRWDARISALCPELVHGYRRSALAGAVVWASPQEWSLQRRALPLLEAGPVAADELVAVLPAVEAALAGLVLAKRDVAHLW